MKLLLVGISILLLPMAFSSDFFGVAGSIGNSNAFFFFSALSEKLDRYQEGSRKSIECFSEEKLAKMYSAEGMAKSIFYSCSNTDEGSDYKAWAKNRKLIESGKFDGRGARKFECRYNYDSKGNLTKVERSSTRINDCHSLNCSPVAMSLSALITKCSDHGLGISGEERRVILDPPLETDNSLPNAPASAEGTKQ